jgi:hypothetical protein
LYYSGGLILDRAASTSLFIAQNGSNQVTLDSSGNLGIGTSSPDIFGRFYTRSVGISSSGSTILQINGSSYGGIDLGAASIRTGSITGSANDIQMGSITSIPLLFVTNGSERMRVDSSGNLLIGNTNGTEKLTVTGNIRASGVYVGNGSTGSYTKGFGAIQTSSSTPATPSGGAAGDHFYYY